MLTADEARALLTSVLRQFDAVRTSPAQVAPGEPVQATVLPAVTQLHAVEALNGLLNMGDLTRHLASPPALVDVPPASAAVAPSGGTAPTPPDDLVRAVTTGPASSATAQGEVAQLLAQLNLSVPRIDVNVQWSLRAPDGKGGYREAVEGEDFVSPTGLNVPSVEVLVVPPVVELTPEALGATVDDPKVPVERWCLFAKVTATLGDAPALVREIGPIPLFVAPLPIPTVVALFNRENFNVTSSSKLLLVSPPHVGLSGLEELNDVLQAVHTVLGRLRMVGKLAGWLLGVGALLKAIPNASHVAFYARDSMKHFDDFSLFSRRFFDDVDINDAVSSMIVIGPPKAEIEFYNESNLRRGEGILVMRIPTTGFVFIRSMRPAPNRPDARPLTIPPDPKNEILIDDGFENDADDNGFDNSMTGIRFRLNKWPKFDLPALAKEGCPPAPTEPVPAGKADVRVTGRMSGNRLALTVANDGPNLAAGVAVEIVGGRAGIGDVTTSQGTAKASGRRAKVTVGELLPEASARISAELKPAGGDFSVTATATSTTEDPDDSNNVFSRSVIG